MKNYKSIAAFFGWVRTVTHVSISITMKDFTPSSNSQRPSHKTACGKQGTNRRRHQRKADIHNQNSNEKCYQESTKTGESCHGKSKLRQQAHFSPLGTRVIAWLQRCCCQDTEYWLNNLFMLVAQNIFLLKRSNIHLIDHLIENPLNSDMQVSLPNFYTASSGTYGTLK